ncbi:hypothetical protein [Streptomyces sp. NPDC001070]|jgi:hypothetical protein
MVYTIVLGVVIVALGLGSIVYTFWHEGVPLSLRRDERHNGAG